MFSSNSFNVCPHCGKANSLNARYCSSCGRQLAVPEEVVVCHKCHRPNSPMASFCGNCGAPLRVGAQTKICPKCHREVDVNQNVCSCGYSFGSVKYANPEDSRVKAKKGKKGKAYAVAADPRNKGGRAIGIIALILLLLFAYLIVVPYMVGEPVTDENGNVNVTKLRPDFLATFDKGIVNAGSEEQALGMYAYDLIFGTIQSFTQENGFNTWKDALGIGGLVLTVFALVVVLTMIFQLVGCIQQIVTGKRRKKKNLFYLIMAILTTLWVVLVVIFALCVAPETEGFLASMRGIIVPALPWGYVMIALPLYYWIFFLYSCATKQKKLKDNLA